MLNISFLTMEKVHISQGKDFESFGVNFWRLLSVMLLLNYKRFSSEKFSTVIHSAFHIL
jgi:hypothetical protein